MPTSLTPEDRKWIRQEIARQIRKVSLRKDALLTAEEAAKFFKVSTKTLRRFTKEHPLRTELAKDSEKLVRYRPEDLKEFARLQKQRTKNRESYGRRVRTSRKMP